MTIWNSVLNPFKFRALLWNPQGLKGDMTDELTLDECLEAWRLRWKRKIGADLFFNRETDLKALFRVKMCVQLNTEKLEGILLRV